MYELAKELEVTSKDILRLLAEEMNIEHHNHMATLNDQVVAKVRLLMAERRGIKAAPAAKKARPEAKPSRPRTGGAPARSNRAGSPAGGAPPATRRAATGPAGLRPGGRPTPARPARTGGPPSGPVHFRPSANLLPLVTPRPIPPRPRRAVQPREQPAAPAPAAQSPAAVEEPVVREHAPTPAPAAEPEAPEAPPPAAPSPGETAEPPAPAAEEPAPTVPRAEPTPTTTPPAPASRPAAATSAPAIVARPGLLPVRKIVPGAPPPLLDPTRPLLEVRKVTPRPAGAGPAPSSAPGSGPSSADRPRGRRDRRGGEAMEIRRRSGTGHRPARPGGVAFGGEEGGRRRGRRRRRHAAQSGAEMELLPPESIELNGPVVVADLADMLRVPAAEVIRRLVEQGVMAAINHQLEVEQARAVAEALGVAVEGGLEPEAPTSPVDRTALEALLADDNPERRAGRPPVVAVLGHVDHGKTTLLDAIRSARVAQGEAGGITQHIGAYVVQKGDRTITFLDTPGHEAFTALRARGAQVTDVAVLVVAADDGVMPQTLEAINHARAAGVPIVVALNKIDKANASPERVLQQLAEHELVPEEWGGDTIVVPVSALQGEGIDQLLEMLMLQADVAELQADPARPAVGTIIEAEVDRGRGPVATVLVQSGTLRVGDTFVAGQVFGRVRAMLNDLGRPVPEAGPSTPVEVLGFDQIPRSGDAFQVMGEREARDTAAERQDESRREALAADRAPVSADVGEDGAESRASELRVLLKGDVHGSVEAVRASLERLHNDEARVVLLHAGVGPVSESDVMLAAASDALILGFNVRPDTGAERAAQRFGVEIRTYRVIYELLDETQQTLDGRLKPKFERVTIGHAEVRKPIRVPDVGVIAGSFVLDGLVRRGAACRVVRDGTIVHEGVIASLRRFKDDVREVAAGYECGIGLERWGDVKEGDVIEVSEEREIPR